MFKWLKNLLGLNAEENTQDVTETYEPEEQTVRTDDLKKLLKERDTLTRLQVKLVKERMLEMYHNHYKEQVSGDYMNNLWRELAPKVPALFSARFEQDPNASVEDICISICEEQFKDVLSRTTESAKRIIKEDVLERLETLFKPYVCDPLKVAMLGEKILLAFDAIEQEASMQDEAAATSEEESSEDETLSCIDSFIQSQEVNHFKPEPEQEEVEYDLGEEDTEPNCYLTDKERRFIELFDLYPHYAPATIFNMIHQEEQK